MDKDFVLNNEMVKYADQIIKEYFENRYKRNMIIIENDFILFIDEFVGKFKDKYNIELFSTDDLRKIDLEISISHSLYKVNTFFRKHKIHWLVKNVKDKNQYKIILIPNN